MRFLSNESVAAINEPPGDRADSRGQGRAKAISLVTCSLLLFPLCRATRIRLGSSLLSGWDPVQFALAIHHFDISKHQPHPPGYIVLVGLAKLPSGLNHDGNLTLTTMAAVFSAFSTVLTFLLAFCMYDARTARQRYW